MIITKQEKKKQKNKKYKTIIKHLTKSINLDIKKKNNSDIILITFKKIQKNADKACKKKIIHQNKANRIKSRIQKFINKISIEEK